MGLPLNFPAVTCIFVGPPPTFDGTSSQAHLLMLSLMMFNKLKLHTNAHTLLAHTVDTPLAVDRNTYKEMERLWHWSIFHKLYEGSIFPSEDGEL